MSGINNPDKETNTPKTESKIEAPKIGNKAPDLVVSMTNYNAKSPLEKKGKLPAPRMEIHQPGSGSSTPPEGWMNICNAAGCTPAVYYYLEHVEEIAELKCTVCFINSNSTEEQEAAVAAVAAVAAKKFKDKIKKEDTELLFVSDPKCVYTKASGIGTFIDSKGQERAKRYILIYDEENKIEAIFPPPVGADGKEPVGQESIDAAAEQMKQAMDYMKKKLEPASEATDVISTQRKELAVS